jgi:hypothetical protein
MATGIMEDVGNLTAEALELCIWPQDLLLVDLS